MDSGEIRRLVFEGRGVVEIHEMEPSISIPRIKEVRLQMIEEGLPIVSPFGLVQERVARGELHEWRIAVICCLMNRTHARQVRPIMGKLFADWPSPVDMENSGPDLDQLLQPLGFIGRRSKAIRTMSKEYARGTPIESCFSVGDYGKQSLRIFVRGETDFVPDDKFLVKYVDWVNGGRVT